MFFLIFSQNSLRSGKTSSESSEQPCCPVNRSRDLPVCHHYLPSLYICSPSLDFGQCIIYMFLKSVPFILNTFWIFFSFKFCTLKHLKAHFTKINILSCLVRLLALRSAVHFLIILKCLLLSLTASPASFQV